MHTDKQGKNDEEFFVIQALPGVQTKSLSLVPSIIQVNLQNVIRESRNGSSRCTDVV